MEERVKAILREIEASHRQLLGDKLTGLYVHGSLAFGCFRWETGDIDYLVVVKEPLSTAEKVGLIEALLRIDRTAPPKGLERSVMLERHCRDVVYPTPFDLHFSNLHKEKARQDPAAYCGWMRGEDKDLAAHFAVTREVGFALFGAPVEEVFAPVPREAFLDSVRYDVADAADGIKDNPVYYVLNLCRALAYLRENRILSKEQGGEWGIRHLSEAYAPLIRKSLEQYRGNPVPWTEADRVCAAAFAAEMMGEVLTKKQ
ncbi:MAG: DUF4111 domain-containing protein [Clostridiaceae bacterium]|nr:DUF4111 domain-containing protein [Clostridiaceae bacterium]